MTKEVMKPETRPRFATEDELISEITSISAALAKGICERKEKAQGYGPEVVAALASSMQNILNSAGVDPDSTMLLALTILRKEIWATCLEQYNLEEEQPDAATEKPS